MAELQHVVGLSGGKDSTALALALREFEPRPYRYICTPTGDETKDMSAWWDRLEILLDAPLERITNPKAPDLDSLIQIMNALPNFRQRWCTRILKIEPTIAWCVKNAPVRLYVGLRNDEEEREGIYGDLVDSDFPFRRWGWGVRDVWSYLDKQGLSDCIPARTDCRRCYHQKIREWWAFWKFDPEGWEEACQQEEQTGHTFRSPGRDTWPSSLREMAREFEKGRKIRGGVDAPQGTRCRACSL